MDQEYALQERPAPLQLLTRAQAQRELELQAFRVVCIRLAGPDYILRPALYNPAKYGGPLHGHCMGVAAAVQARWGGRILYGHVPPEVGPRGGHWWNRLDDGTEIDLTSAQFGGDGWQPLPEIPPWATMETRGVQWIQAQPHVARFLYALTRAEMAEREAKERVTHG